MARDDGKDPSPLLWALMRLLDGGRPSGMLGWVSPVAPVVTQAAAGAGHWAAGRRQRALAEWAQVPAVPPGEPLPRSYARSQPTSRPELYEFSLGKQPRPYPESSRPAARIFF
jgi:hypothetical protein